jgi:2-dehydropantoate 2-reductase
VKTVIVGAGALGSVLGGYFAQTGADVTLLAREAHAQAIRTQGLRIGGMRGEQIVRSLRALSDPAEVTSAELLILGVKSYDTQKTLASLGHLCGKVGAAISMQNGGRKDEELGEVFGKEAVVGATTIVGAAMPEAGRVIHTSEGGTWIGELDGRRSARVEAIAELFRKAALPIEVREDIRSAIWCKLNQMVPVAALSCLTRLRIHEIYQDRTLATLFVELSHEVARVAERLGIPLVDCQGFPVRTLCSQSVDAAVESVMTRGRIMQERGMTGVKISTLQDLERGRRTEADHVIGHVIRLAAAHGIAVPKLQLFFRVIQGVEAAQARSGSGDHDREGTTP